MKRSFKYIPIVTTNVAQPAVGTVTTAAVPISNNPGQSIAVQDSTVFDQGTWAILDVNPPGANIPVAGAGAGEERVWIDSIPDALHIVIHIPGDGGGLAPTGCQKAHVSGVYIRPARQISNIYVQTKDGNVNPMFVSESVLGKTDGTRCISKLQNVPAGQQPTSFADSFTSDAGPNPSSLAEYWVVGTAGDNYLPSFGVV